MLAGSAPQALVLAGGLGTRLRPCLADRPKALADVGGRPFLHHVLDQLHAGGVRRAVLCTGHLGEHIEREYGDRYGTLEIAYSREAAPLGTAGALRQALPLCHGDVLVLNGDSYCGTDLAGFVRWARASGAPAALVAVEVEDRSRFGGLVLDCEGRVLAFEEKRHGRGPGPINAGIYWFRRDTLLAMPDQSPLSLERDVLPALAGSGTAERSLRAWRVQAPFLDIGTPESYAAAQTFFADARPARRAGARAGLLVLDRDGTVITEKHYLADPRGVELLPGAAAGLRCLAERGYEIAIVTNQSGVGRGYFDTATLAAIHAELEAQLAREGVELAGIWHCPHRPEDGCACRKPEPGLLQLLLAELGYEPTQCTVVGDKPCDIDLGKRIGAKTALVRTGYGTETERSGACAPDLVVDGLAELSVRLAPVGG